MREANVQLAYLAEKDCLPLSHLILTADCLLLYVGTLVNYPHKVMEITLVHLLTVLLTH